MRFYTPCLCRADGFIGIKKPKAQGRRWGICASTRQNSYPRTKQWHVVDLWAHGFRNFLNALFCLIKNPPEARVRVLLPPLFRPWGILVAKRRSSAGTRSRPVYFDSVPMFIAGWLAGLAQTSTFRFSANIEGGITHDFSTKDLELINHSLCGPDSGRLYLHIRRAPADPLSFDRNTATGLASIGG